MAKGLVYGGLNSSGKTPITPFMSIVRLQGRIMAINDKYYVEGVQLVPCVMNVRDKKTHKVIKSITTSYLMYEGKGVLSGDYYIGSYRDSGGAYLLCKFNILTGVLTGLGSAAFSAGQPSGIYHEGHHYFLKNNTTVLKYDNLGNEVMVITITTANTILGATGNKLFLSYGSASFIIIDVTNGMQVGSFVPGSYTGYTMYNATFLNNGNMIVGLKYNDATVATLLLESIDGLVYTAKTTLNSHGTPIMVDATEKFYVYNPSSTETKLVDNQLNVLQVKPTSTIVYMPYDLTEKNNPYVYASTAGPASGALATSSGFIITKGEII